MENEEDHTINRKKIKKIKRLKKMIDIDFCACCGGHKLKCEGVCRKAHTNTNTGRVECAECYRIDRDIVKRDGPRHSKCDWKYSNPKDENNNKRSKKWHNKKQEID